jgi:hypothetical protein
MGLNTAANNYYLTIHGSVGFASTVQVSGADSPWSTLFTQDATGAFTLNATITASTVGSTGSRGWLRVQTNNTANLTIYEIEIRRGGAATVVAPPPAAPTGAIYSLAGDDNFQGISMGTSGSGTAVLQPTPHLMDAGSPTFTIVENPLGGNALQLSNRTEYWHAIDLMRAEWGMDTAANSYRIVVRGVAAPHSEIVLGGRTSPWNHLHTVTAGADGSFVIDTTLSNAVFEAETEGGAGQFATGFRIQVQNMNNYTIHEITVTRN